MHTVVFLITRETRNSDGSGGSTDCEYPFKIGETYLVYANGKENELRTSLCSRTSPLTLAEEDLRILGEGKEPIKSIPFE